MDPTAFFFSFETVLPERTLEAASGGIPEWGGQASQRPLAVPGVIVQNGRAQSCLTHRAATTDRAEIGRINGVAFTVATGWIVGNPETGPKRRCGRSLL